MLATAEIAASGQNSLPVCLWKENPNRLVSLWDMLERYAFGFYEVVSRLDRIRGYASVYETASHATMKVSNRQFEELLECLPEMRTECDALALTSTSELAGHIESEVLRKQDGYTYKELLHDLDTLSFSFSAGLEKRTAFLIDDEKKKYFQMDDLFGVRVDTAFPSCAAEIRNAGNCYALEQYDATAFHAMRILERGLNALATKFGVDFAHSNWHNVIEQIESKIRKIDSTFGVDWKEQQKFCSQAASQFMFLKDAWRNHIMHVRAVPYDLGTALSVFGHVKEVMRALADGGLKE